MFIGLLRSVPVAALVAFMFVSAAFGQGVTGVVTDPQQAVVSSANVTVTNVNTGSVNKTQTRGSGVYNVTSLPIGTYEIRVELAGFTAYVQQNITVEVARVVRVDPVLEIGAVGDSVTVQAGTELLQTETSSISTQVSKRC